MTPDIMATAIFCSVAAAAAELPKLSTVRYDEDYSHLRDPAAGSRVSGFDAYCIESAQDIGEQPRMPTNGLPSVTRRNRGSSLLL
jgi:hypothetical protein